MSVADARTSLKEKCWLKTDKTNPLVRKYKVSKLNQLHPTPRLQWPVIKILDKNLQSLKTGSIDWTLPLSLRN